MRFERCESVESLREMSPEALRGWALHAVTAGAHAAGGELDD